MFLFLLFIIASWPESTPPPRKSKSKPDYESDYESCSR